MSRQMGGRWVCGGVRVASATGLAGRVCGRPLALQWLGGPCCGRRLRINGSRGGCRGHGGNCVRRQWVFVPLQSQWEVRRFGQV